MCAVDALAEGDPDKRWTIDELALWGGTGGRGPMIVGSSPRSRGPAASQRGRLTGSGRV
jgi:hypothetical protein